MKEEQAKKEDYEQIRVMAYERQDLIVATLRAAGIDPYCPITTLAIGYMLSQTLGRDEAIKLRVAKEVGVM
jgi:hypothetical protein